MRQIEIEELAIRGACDFDAFYADRFLAPEPTAADHLIGEATRPAKVIDAKSPLRQLDQITVYST